jgi:hypothetical protein
MSALWDHNRYVVGTLDDVIIRGTRYSVVPEMSIWSDKIGCRAIENRTEYSCGERNHESVVNEDRACSEFKVDTTGKL